jgi:hypothetical protein
MVSTERSNGRLPLVAMATVLGILVVSISSSMAQQPGCTCPVHGAQKAKPKKNQGTYPPSGVGTLGYGPPGLHEGFQGFGLGYHLGYGYGGTELGLGHGPYALGVGAEGGYPNYGGPGYPHPAPVLSRKLAIVPFCHFAGPGFPTPENPNFFGGPAGQLVPDTPVVTFEADPALPTQEAGYGQFDGTLPYPESAFAPYATMIGEYGTASETSGGSPASTGTPPASGALGMVFEPFTETGRTPGLKITSVVPRGLAARVGVSAGDVMVSINGYVTQKLTDPEWIILNASPDKVLKMTVRSVSDAKEREVTIQLP